MVDGLERDFPQLQVFRLDFNREADAAAARALRIPYHPALLLIDTDGNSVERIVGPPEEGALREAVAAVVE